MSTKEELIEKFFGSLFGIIGWMLLVNVNVVVGFEAGHDVPKIGHLKGEVVEDEKDGKEVVALRLPVLTCLLSFFL